MDDISLWWIALGGGLVVLLAVFALLSMLYRSVRKVESAVTPLVEIGGSVGANTAKIRDLLTTAWVLNQIRDEALVHDEFLSSQ